MKIGLDGGAAFHQRRQLLASKGMKSDVELPSLRGFICSFIYLFLATDAEVISLKPWQCCFNASFLSDFLLVSV